MQEAQVDNEDQVALVAQVDKAEVEAQDQDSKIQAGKDPVQEVPVVQAWVEEDPDPVEWVDQEDPVDTQALEEVVQAQEDIQDQEDQVEDLKHKAQDQEVHQALEIYLVELIH